jgi:hypothetical protein
LAGHPTSNKSVRVIVGMLHQRQLQTHARTIEVSCTGVNLRWAASAGARRGKVNIPPAEILYVIGNLTLEREY